VHGLDLGYRSHLLGDRLRLSLDLFYNIYKDSILFHADIPLRLGLPDMANATIEYRNGSTDVTAFGGEAEVVAWPAPWLKVWVNFMLRKVSGLTAESQQHVEPSVRCNFGGRFDSTAGWFLDAAFHYVSSYEFFLPDPENQLQLADMVEMGNQFILFMRLGVPLNIGEEFPLEAGLMVRAPLGKPFREVAGTPMPLHLHQESTVDMGGDMVNRLVLLYLRGSL
jgi:hypothetical protein